MFSSPRERQLQRVATTTIEDHDILPPSKWSEFKQPLPLILQTFQGLTDKSEDFWYQACPFFQRKEYAAGTTLYKRGDRPNGFYLLEDGILRAGYDLPQGQYDESIVAGTTCGELPFFSETNRTATVVADKDCTTWLLDDERWEELQKRQPDVAQELLRISLKLTSERLSAITSSVARHPPRRPLLTGQQILLNHGRMKLHRKVCTKLVKVGFQVFGHERSLSGSGYLSV